MKILVLSKYSRSGASSRLRIEQYLPYFQTHGHDVTIQCLFGESYLSRLYLKGGRSFFEVARSYLERFFFLIGIYKYDVVFIEKEIFPYLPAVIERLIGLAGVPYVVDYDDAVFHNYDLSSNWFFRKVLGRKIDIVMRNARCVTAGNAYLASRAVTAGAPEVRIIPTVVDASRYHARDSTSAALVIGWIGSPSTQKYVVGIKRALINVCSRYSCKLMLVGATKDVLEDLSELNVEVVSWSENTEADLIRVMDVGIMPLNDGPWENGKCGYKLIQYMASAVPVVASPIGVNVEIVEGSRCGLLAGSEVDWEEALSQLLKTPELRHELGRAGRQAVDKTYSLQVQAPILTEILVKSAQR